MAAVLKRNEEEKANEGKFKMMVAFLAMGSGFCGHRRGAESGMVLSLGNCEKESSGKNGASAFFYTFESSKHERKASIGVGFTAVSPPKTCSACAPWYWDSGSRRTPRGQNANSTYQTNHPPVRSFLAHISLFSPYWNTSYNSAHHIRPQRDPSQKFTFTETCRRHPRM